MEAPSDACGAREGLNSFQVALSDDLEQLSSTCHPKLGISFPFLANLRVSRVPLHRFFKRGQRFDFVFHHDLIKVAGQVGENTEISEFAGERTSLSWAANLLACPGFAVKLLRTTIMIQVPPVKILSFVLGCFSSQVVWRLFRSNGETLHPGRHFSGRSARRSRFGEDC